VTSSDTKFVRVLIFVNAIVPAVLLVWDWRQHQLGTNPIEFVTRTTGVLTLLFLLITLAVTPLRKLLGLQWLIKHRRMLGLFAFFYGFLHLITYVWFDKFFAFGEIVKDVGTRRFILVGMASFLALIPLAVTSTNKMIKRLGGKTWNRIHKLTYLAAIGGVIHYWMIVKSDIRIPLCFGVVLAALLIYRLLAKYKPELISRTPQTSPIPRR
jgi:sulfoxide reductase heme-binding subunit YedZ